MLVAPTLLVYIEVDTGAFLLFYLFIYLFFSFYFSNCMCVLTNSVVLIQVSLNHGQTASADVNDGVCGVNRK